MTSLPVMALLREGDPAVWRQGEPETFLQNLDVMVARGGDRVFLDFDGAEVTYRQIDERSNRMAHALADLGVTADQTVVTLLDSSEDLVVAWFAINKLGAIWVPLNTAYRGEFLRHQIADSGARLVICESHYLNHVARVADRLTALRLILGRGVTGASAAGAVPIEPLDSHRGDDDTRLATAPRPEGIACLIYTSGTTGPSKGCMVSHNYLCNGGRQQNMAVPPRPGETTWTCLPLFHVGATSYVVVATLIAGARARIAPHFSVSGFWPDIERSGATTAMLMASMLPLLAHAPDNDAMHRCRGRLRAVTGVPLTEPVRAIWQERFGVNHMNSFGYGQTEASKICNLPWGDSLPPLTSAGRPSEDFEVIIADDGGRPLAAGQAGEILVRPRRPGIMFAGYWRRPEETVKVWRDLWMHTGDIGRFDAAGYLYFVDRKNDYVRSRGENISSLEIEAAIAKHPSVLEVAYHAVAAAEGGEDDIKATIVLRDAADLVEEQLFHWCADNLPYFAVPRFIEFRSALPKTPTGRVQKHQLRDAGCTGKTWDSRAVGLAIRRR